MRLTSAKPDVPTSPKAGSGQSCDAASFRDSEHATPARSPPDYEIAAGWSKPRLLSYERSDSRQHGHDYTSTRHRHCAKTETSPYSESQIDLTLVETKAFGRSSLVLLGARRRLVGCLRQVGVFCSLSGTTRRSKGTLVSNGEPGRTEHRDQPSVNADPRIATR